MKERKERQTVIKSLALTYYIDIRMASNKGTEQVLSSSGTHTTNSPTDASNLDPGAR